MSAMSECAVSRWAADSSSTSAPAGRPGEHETLEPFVGRRSHRLFERWTVGPDMVVDEA